MNRTQIYLTDEQLQKIHLKAKLEQKPKAEIIRQLVDQGLQGFPKNQNESAGDALLRLAKIAIKGSKDLSSRIDEELYGEGK